MRSEAWRPAAAACNCWPREAREAARQALRPGREELAVRIRVMPETEARPRVKNRHGGAASPTVRGRLSSMASPGCRRASDPLGTAVGDADRPRSAALVSAVAEMDAGADRCPVGFFAHSLRPAS